MYLYKVFFRTITNISKDTNMQILIGTLTMISCTVALFMSVTAGLAVYVYFILGISLSIIFEIYHYNIYELFRKFLQYYKRKDQNFKLKNMCHICDGVACKRHIMETQNMVPWEDLLIDNNLNHAVKHLFNHILENVILSWYGQFSQDEDFLIELRRSLRYTSASIIKRFLQLNLSEIFTKKLIPCFTKHIEDYYLIKGIATKNKQKFNDAVVKYYGKRLHIATCSRQHEINYLRFISKRIMDNVISYNYKNCKHSSILIREIMAGWIFLPLADVLSNPNSINSLIIKLSLLKTKYELEGDDKNVQFLNGFLNANIKKPIFASKLENIKENVDLLYLLMTFLKKCKVVHLLQFILDVDSIRYKHKLNSTSPKELSTDLLKMHKDFFTDGNPHYIGYILKENIYVPETNGENYDFDFIFEGLKLLEKPYIVITKEIEDFWLPQFFHTSKVYGYFYGTLLKHENRRTPQKKLKKSTETCVEDSKESLENLMFVFKRNAYLQNSSFVFEHKNFEDIFYENSYFNKFESFFENLHSWVAVVDPLEENNANSNFCVTVNIYERNETTNEIIQWKILRKSQDFNTLKTKLVEFYEENFIMDLTSSCTNNTTNIKCERYTNFLNGLLQKNSFRRSDWLFLFLTYKDDFTIFVSTSGTFGQDLGSMYQSITYKLRKERGQCLETFMTNYFNSIKLQECSEATNEVTDEVNSNEDESTVSIPKTYHSDIFNDNFGVKYSELQKTSSNYLKPMSSTDSLYYLLKNVFKVSSTFLKFYTTMSIFAHEVINITWSNIATKMIKMKLSQENLKYVIYFLEGVIFMPSKLYTKDVLDDNKRKAQIILKNVFSSSTLINMIFKDNLYLGCINIFEVLQNPCYNKQLFYNMLDILFLELYPLQ